MIYAAQEWYVTNTYYVTLNWRLSRSADVVGYEIWISPRKGGPYFMADTINDRNANRHTLASMPPGIYHFIMTSIDKNKNRSLQSNEVLVSL